MSHLSEQQAQEAKSVMERVHYELKRVIVGQDYLLERILVAMLSNGHVLVEGAPGLAKTLTLKSLAKVLSVEFKRIQFTPDLLPSDLIGTRIFNPASSEFKTELGPLSANLILADEINRAPAKVQSALLEAMEEHQITIGKETFELASPFLVMATQNPIESEGTYPLPEAQLDRFLMKLLVAYPDAKEEMVIIQRMTAEETPELEAILHGEDIVKLTEQARQVYMDPVLMNYVVDIITATRAKNNPHILYGASPRGSLAITNSAKSLALLRGRNYVTPEDVTALIKDCLRHRIILTYEGLSEGLDTDKVLGDVIKKIPVPVLTGV